MRKAEKEVENVEKPAKTMAKLAFQLCRRADFHARGLLRFQFTVFSAFLLEIAMVESHLVNFREKRVNMSEIE